MKTNELMIVNFASYDEAYENEIGIKRWKKI